MNRVSRSWLLLIAAGMRVDPKGDGTGVLPHEAWARVPVYFIRNYVDSVPNSNAWRVWP